MEAIKLAFKATILLIATSALSESPRQNYDKALAENEYAKLSREIKYLDIVRTGKYQRALRDTDIAHVEKLGWYLTR